MAKTPKKPAKPSKKGPAKPRSRSSKAGRKAAGGEDATATGSTAGYGTAGGGGGAAVAHATISDARIGLNKHSSGPPCDLIIEGTNLQGPPDRTEVIVKHIPTGNVFVGKVHKLLVGNTVALARVRLARRGPPLTTTGDLSITVQNPTQPTPSTPHREDGDVYTDP